VKKVLFYDHEADLEHKAVDLTVAMRELGEAASELDQEAIDSLEGCSADGAASWIPNADLVVFHGRHHLHRTLCNEQLNTQDGLVVVWLSSQVLPIGNRVVPFGDPTQNCCRFVLACEGAVEKGLGAVLRNREPNPDAKANWQDLIRALENRRALADWLTGEDHGHAELLERVFGSGKRRELVPALAILCQGFLAVQCGPDPDPVNEDGFTVEIDVHKDRIRKAVKDMGWGDVLRSPECASQLDRRLTDPESSQRDGLRGDVVLCSYWNVFNETDAVRLIATAKKEWDGLSRKGNFGPVKTLLEAIPRVPEASVDSDFPRKVAEAYLALALKLRGA